MLGTVICKELTVRECISVVALYASAIQTFHTAQAEWLLTFCSL